MDIFLARCVDISCRLVGVWWHDHLLPLCALELPSVHTECQVHGSRPQCGGSPSDVLPVERKSSLGLRKDCLP